MPPAVYAGWGSSGLGITNRGFTSIRRRRHPEHLLCSLVGSSVPDIHGSIRRGGQGVSDLLRWGSVSFPEKERLWSRTSRGFAFVSGHRKATALGAVAVIGVAASVYFGVGYARYGWLATAEQRAAMRAESANADLQDALARLRDQLGAANQALNQAQSRIGALSDEAKSQQTVSEQAATSKAERVSQLTHALEQAQRELHLAEAQRVTLMARLSKAAADLAEEQARQQQAQSGIEQWQKKFFFSSGRRHTRLTCDWSSDVCSSDLLCANRWRPARRRSCRARHPRRDGTA